MDEKGFLLGVLQKMMRVYTKETLKQGLLLGAKQDGSREWITLVGCCCADGTALPPSIIYQAKSEQVHDLWLNDWKPEEEEAYFSASESGWTNEEIGFSWLVNIFDRCTKAKARQGRDWRLLICDGHNSHLNMAFLDWCHHHRILVLIFPPHSTHRLQPLDVTCFRSIAQLYSKYLNEWLTTTQGLVGMGKRDFWRIFKPAFDGAFRSEVIESGFKQTGLWPLDPDQVLQHVDRFISDGRPSSTHSGGSALSASNIQVVRELIRSVVGEAVSREARVLARTIDHLAAEVKFLRLENAGLKEAFQAEKKHHKRAKPLLEAMRQPEDGNALWWSPKKFGEAVELERQKEVEQEEEETRKADEKLQRQLQKEEREKEAAARKATAVEVRKQKAIEKAEKAAVREAAKQAKASEKQRLLEAKEVKKQASNKKKQANQSKGAAALIDAFTEPEVGGSSQTRSGRNSKAPKRWEPTLE